MEQVIGLIVIALIWIAQSIISANKKKQQKGMPPPPREKEKETLEDVFGEIFGTNTPAPKPASTSPKTPTVPNHIPDEKEYVNEYQRYMEEKRLKDSQRKRVEYQEPLEIIELEESTREPFQFDIRKAVIYSEILGKPGWQKF